MKKNIIITTDRLVIREFASDDSPFVLELLNSKSWKQYIGDKNVRSLQDAKEYLKGGPIKSYHRFGYGLWLVALKESDTPIGMCGLVKREALKDVDIGFALLPQYEGLGYGFEMSNAVIAWGDIHQKLARIVAITHPTNLKSISLLGKLGLHFEQSLTVGGEKLLLFSKTVNQQERAQIDAVTKLFFSSFTNVGGKAHDLQQLKGLLMPDAVITNMTKEPPEYYTVESFIAPRIKILNDGTLTDFSESEISNETHIFNKVAQRFCLYQKSGILRGKRFETYGMKTIQFIKPSKHWKISAVAWDDCN